MKKTEMDSGTAKLLFTKSQWEIRKTSRSIGTLCTSCLFLAFISLCLTILNILKNYWFMTIATSVLTIGMLTGYLLAKKGLRLVSSVILSVLIAYLFSVFAVTGENDGFAILWIILVPIIAMNLLSIELGSLLSLYFQIFLIVIFYTPLREVVGNGHFTPTFIMRFPLLYLCSFGGTFILAINKEKNYVIRTMQSHTDGLTGLFNRARYNLELETKNDNGIISVVSLDLNGLKIANDTFGHEAGDKLIINASNVLKRTWADSGSIFRLGGDEFTVIVRKSSEKLKKDFEAFRKNLADINASNDVKVSFSLGSASSDTDGTSDIGELEKIADARMYSDKELYYSMSEHERRKGK